MSKAPPRLIEDPSAESALRQDLERARDAVPVYDVTAGLAALKAAIDAGGPASAGATGDAAGGAKATGVGAAGKAAGGAGAFKLGAGVAAAAALVAALVVAVLPGRPSAPAPAPIGAKAAGGTVPAPAGASEVVRDERQAVAHESESAAATTGDRPPRRPRPPRAAGDAKLRAEIAELARIKRLLNTDPAAAYRLAERGHRRFGRGMLYPEREALAILALSALGRDPAAVARARGFVSAFPQSPLRGRVAGLLPAVESASGGGASPPEGGESATNGRGDDGDPREVR